MTVNYKIIVPNLWMVLKNCSVTYARVVLLVELRLSLGFLNTSNVAKNVPPYINYMKKKNNKKLSVTYFDD